MAWLNISDRGARIIFTVPRPCFGPSRRTGGGIWTGWVSSSGLPAQDWTACTECGYQPAAGAGPAQALPASGTPHRARVSDEQRLWGEDCHLSCPWPRHARSGCVDSPLLLVSWFAHAILRGTGMTHSFNPHAETTALYDAILLFRQRCTPWPTPAASLTRSACPGAVPLSLVVFYLRQI
jgi:hypothetical protein